MRLFVMTLLAIGFAYLLYVCMVWFARFSGRQLSRATKEINDSFDDEPDDTGHPYRPVEPPKEFFNGD